MQISPADDSSSLTASATSDASASESPVHVITLHRGDGVKITYEFPEPADFEVVYGIATASGLVCASGRPTP
jgi:hypothetical protein